MSACPHCDGENRPVNSFGFIVHCFSDRFLACRAMDHCENAESEAPAKKEAEPERIVVSPGTLVAAG